MSGEIYVPSDIQEFGVRHGIPTFAEATYRNGYVAGYRAACEPVEKLTAALEWALPLASQYQAYIAGERAKAGHHGLGTKHSCLYDSEVESEANARTALAQARRIEQP